MIKSFLIGSLLILSTTAFAAIDSSVEFKPVHEALITRISPLAPIEVIATQPPEELIETQPPKPHPDMVWINGYWSWNRDMEDFEWICGLWRLPPLNHSWVPGYWNQSSGWWWVGGYWKSNTSQPTVSQKAPPNNLEENTGNPPNSDSFWAPGYWTLNPYLQTYSWLGGSWQPFDPNFIFVPAYWQYRPEGYMFHAAFWDWKLEDRGIAYDCRGTEMFPITTEVIISRIYVWYPDYHLFFWSHWHCCHDFWVDCWCSPPWWGWWGWWTLDWHNQWGLWWWWGHPGFPAPAWMTSLLASQIAPPNNMAISFFENAPKPPFITPNGVASFENWLDAAEDLTGQRTPLIPADMLDQASEQAGENLPESPIDRPTGPGEQVDVPKPSFDDEAKPLGTAPMPPRPRDPQVNAPMPPKPEITPPRDRPVDVPPVTIPPAYPDPVYPPPVYDQPPVYIVPPVGRPPIFYPPGRRPPHHGGKDWGKGGHGGKDWDRDRHGGRDRDRNRDNDGRGRGKDGDNDRRGPDRNVTPPTAPQLNPQQGPRVRPGQTVTPPRLQQAAEMRRNLFEQRAAAQQQQRREANLRQNPAMIQRALEQRSATLRQQQPSMQRMQQQPSVQRMQQQPSMQRMQQAPAMRDPQPRIQQHMRPGPRSEDAQKTD